jgi:hypothetical protein
MLGIIVHLTGGTSGVRGAHAQEIIALAGQTQEAAKVPHNVYTGPHCSTTASIFCATHGVPRASSNMRIPQARETLLRSRNLFNLWAWQRIGRLLQSLPLVTDQRTHGSSTDLKADSDIDIGSYVTHLYAARCGDCSEGPGPAGSESPDQRCPVLAVGSRARALELVTSRLALDFKLIGCIGGRHLAVLLLEVPSACGCFSIAISDRTDCGCCVMSWRTAVHAPRVNRTTMTL